MKIGRGSCVSTNGHSFASFNFIFRWWCTGLRSCWSQRVLLSILSLDKGVIFTLYSTEELERYHEADHTNAWSCEHSRGGDLPCFRDETSHSVSKLSNEVCWRTYRLRQYTSSTSSISYKCRPYSSQPTIFRSALWYCDTVCVREGGMGTSKAYGVLSG